MTPKASIGLESKMYFDHPRSYELAEVTPMGPPMVVNPGFEDSVTGSHPAVGPLCWATLCSVVQDCRFPMSILGRFG
jgi:hypothetical protein